jgi:hypothetical protein
MSTNLQFGAMRLARAAALCLTAAALAPACAWAQQFAAMVSPPRFELEGQPGVTQRQVIEITNSDVVAANYRLRTMDWSLDEKGVVKLFDSLAPDSCRPWVAIERREITVPAGGRYRYRFEVTPPTEAAGECRFAIVVEGGVAAVAAGQNVRIPVNAQIGIIVYVTLPGAVPDLSVVRTAVAEREGRQVPLVFVKNTGRAHGRLDGFLEGTDAAGRRIDFSPSGMPILPGETREIMLTPASEADPRPTVTFPLAIRGNLEWSGKSTPFEARFAP